MTFDPLTTPEILDHAILGGKSTKDLGLIYIEGFSNPRKWDEQPGYGLEGSGLKLTGLGLPEGVLRINSWLPSHFVAWAEFQRSVLTTKTAGAKGAPGFTTPTSPGLRPLDLRHPMTDDLGIFSVVVTDEGQWTLIDDTGLWERQVKLKKYRKPTPMLAQPDGSIDKPKSDDDAPTHEEVVLAGLQKSLDDAKKADAAVP